MLRSLAIRNFVVVEALDVEFDPGFTVLTGETGAGKSILLDALGLLLGDRFLPGQLRAGAGRAELAALFDVADAPTVGAWLVENDLVGEDEGVLLRRVLDDQGRSRAWINARPATLAQMKALGEHLVDIHGQHAHQSLGVPEAQRELVDTFGGFTALAQEVALCWRSWRQAQERRDAAAEGAAASAAQREALEARRRELAALAVAPGEWARLSATQSRLANAATLVVAAADGVATLAEADDAVTLRLAQLQHRMEAAAAHDPALAEAITLLTPARIQLEEAARALRDYQRHLELDPAEHERVEQRLSAIHDLSRKYRVRPETLPDLLATTEVELAALAAGSDATALAKQAEAAEAAYRAAARQLAQKRNYAGNELAHRVTTAMQQLAMEGGRFEVGVDALATPASYGLEDIEFRVSSHPRQPLAPLARVASGGELSRIALAVQVAASEAGHIPTLVFDEVDAGVGGAVAATVGRLLQALGGRRQVLCVTHLPQVAACADVHLQVTKTGDAQGVRSGLARLQADQRIEEVARMLGGETITAKTRANARELLDSGARRPPTRA